MADNSSSDDGWVFDSLVNFLHGPVWKLPVMGFIEEKSVVFDPDSYNNMTDEKEDEYRSIHEEYKALVDYMLTNFMEDIQVSPEQVEDACRIREQTNKVNNLPESHITKVALEQLWAAEDFGAFRRLMTRKNIDLQLQSLELLVAKYGILSPSLRPPNTDEDELGDPNAEEDFLQVVIRYTEPDAIFQSSLLTLSKNRPALCDTPTCSQSVTADEKCHSKSIQSKRRSCMGKSLTQPYEFVGNFPDSRTKVAQQKSLPGDCTNTVEIPPQNQDRSPVQEISSPVYVSPLVTVVSVHEEGRSSPSNEPDCQIMQQEEEEMQQFKPVTIASQPDGDLEPKSENEDKPTPQINVQAVDSATEKSDQPAPSKTDGSEGAEIASSAPEQHRILSAVRRALDMPPESAESDVDPSTLELLSNHKGSPEEVERRREYLKSQRDKLIAMKKRERQKQFHSIDVQPGLGRSDSVKGTTSIRPKSAKAAQIAVNSPESVIAAGTTEKSLQARRALAQRLRQELLVEK